MRRILWAVFPALLIAGCGERDQVQISGSNTNRGDVPPWQAAKTTYTAKGWSPGDKAAWEAQMRTRSQAQNEYNKVN